MIQSSATTPSSSDLDQDREMRLMVNKKVSISTPDP